ncbi:MAG: hypothetical protein JWP89_2780 [Schlesneria sp.]|nr:hypothetical protein [Schlesneria sp.]
MLNDDLSQRDASIALRKLAASTEPVEAARWQKLVELVDYLQGNAPDCDIDSSIIFNTLGLSKPFPADPDRDREFEKFMEEWRALHPDSEKWGNDFLEAARPFYSKRIDSIKVTIDWPDFGPLENGMPIMHYRFRIERAESTMSEDARASDLVSAKQIICTALGM